MSLFQNKFPELKNIPANARYFREKAGMNMSQVKRKVGVDPSALRKLESGRMYNPSIATLLALVEAYDCELNDLVYRIPEPEEISRIH